jgi:opacity protein-like surface antigen
MKRLIIAALLAVQVPSTAAARAAVSISHQSTGSTRFGSFAGARLRIPLDHSARTRFRAGLTLAPTTHSVGADGTAALRIGKGLEYGFSDRDALQLSLGGRPVSAITKTGRQPGGERLNVSTAGWVAIGVGVVVVGIAGYALWLTNELSKNEGD